MSNRQRDLNTAAPHCGSHCHQLRVFCNTAVSVAAGQNFIVSDCDLWVSGTVFKCDGGHQARFGLIANNTIMNGGACHWFDQAKQVIFENNTCTGNNPMTMGNVRLLLS